MSFALRREKALPDIPVDIDPSGTDLEDEVWLTPSPKIVTSANTNKVLPSIRVENTLSEEEMARLHELWNGAGLSARAHRRRQRGHNRTPRRIPAPISIPEPGITILPTSSSVDPSTTSTTPQTTGTGKRWGFLSARPFSETQKAEKKVPNALETLRAMAQGRLKKKLRYAKSAPNLGDQAAPPEKGVTHQPAVPVPAEVAPKDVKASNTPPSPGELTTPQTVLQPEDMDENAIYFTIDPNWRASQGSVQFQFITPIPDSSTSLGRPDSPPLHRHHSLCQLAFSAQETTKPSTTMEFPDSEMHSSDEALHPIDELHSFLEL